MRVHTLTPLTHTRKNVSSQCLNRYGDMISIHTTYINHRKHTHSSTSNILLCISLYSFQVPSIDPCVFFLLTLDIGGWRQTMVTSAFTLQVITFSVSNVFLWEIYMNMSTCFCLICFVRIFVNIRCHLVITRLSNYFFLNGVSTEMKKVWIIFTHYHIKLSRESFPLAVVFVYNDIMGYRNKTHNKNEEEII